MTGELANDDRVRVLTLSSLLYYRDYPARGLVQEQPDARMLQRNLNCTVALLKPNLFIKRRRYLIS